MHTLPLTLTLTLTLSLSLSLSLTLSRLDPVMHTFASISGPLVGYPLPSSSSIVKSGMWFMANVVKDVTLAQLCLADCDEPAESLVGQITQPEGAPRFRHVLLVGSQQDKYVPLYSSLLHMPAALAASSDRRAPLLRRLVEGSLDSMAASNLIRVDVHFRDPPKYFSLDQVAGRAVHTKFLENTEFLRLFAARYAHCFES